MDPQNLSCEFAEVEERVEGETPTPNEGEEADQAKNLAAVTELDQFREDMLINICEKESEVEVAKNDWDLKKELASDAKKVFDGLVNQLLALIRKVKNPPAMPLFDGIPETKPSDAGTRDRASGDPEAWRSVPLSEALVGLQEAIIVSLNEANLQTMGVPGVGKVGAIRHLRGEPLKPKQAACMAAFDLGLALRITTLRRDVPFDICEVKEQGEVLR